MKKNVKLAKGQSCGFYHKVTQKNYTIIHNGFDPKAYDGIDTYKFGFSKMLIACAKWRPLKRPRSIAKGFIESNIKDAVLVMIGDISPRDKIKHENVKYVGKVNPPKIFKYYVSCDGVIHISRLDACPNVVVEGIVAKKPIICNNTGGTPEVVMDSGVVLDIDPTFNYQMFKMKKPDSVKPSIIAQGINKLFSKKWLINRNDLHMCNCAKKYFEFFKRVLSC